MSAVATTDEPPAASVAAKHCLELDGITVERGDFTVLDRVSIRVQSGVTLVLQGPNGCGKTTLLRVAAGLTSPAEGAVRYRGRSITDDFAGYARELLWYGHKAGLKDELTVAENLDLQRRLRHADALPTDAALAAFAVDALAEQPVATLSAGQKRRAALARLVLATVSIWVLDEPFTNLDQASSSTLHTLIAEHNARGGICLMAAHGLDVAAHPAYQVRDLGAKDG